MSTITPKPCPFCGAKGKALVYSNVSNYIVCTACNTVGPTKTINEWNTTADCVNRAEAARAWNNRK